MISCVNKRTFYLQLMKDFLFCSSSFF